MRHRVVAGTFGIPAAAAFCLVLAFAGALCAQTVQVQPAPATPFRFSFPAQSVGTTLGVEVRDVSEADVRAQKLPAQAGAYVTSVRSGGPAEQAGIRAGDVIVEFDGDRVRSAAQLERLVSETPANRQVKIAVIRGGERKDLTATLRVDLDSAMKRFFTNPGWPQNVPSWPQAPEELQPQVRPRPLPPASPFPPPSYRPPDDWSGYYYYFGPNRRTPYEPRGRRFVIPGPRLGISVQELTPQLAEYFRTKEGVLVSAVEGGSAAALAGLKAGDIITSADGRPVAQPDDVTSAIRAKHSGERVTLGIVRDGRKRTITATLE